MSTPILSRSQIPVQQHSLRSTPKLAREIPKGDLNLRVCPKCDFAANDSFDSSKFEYDPSYDNSRIHSPYFAHHLNKTRDYLIYEKGIQRSTILEIGCGKGEFLKQLVQDDSLENYGIGYDPSYEETKTSQTNRLQFKKTLFSSSTHEQNVDVVMCLHVLEHIPDPIEFLSSIKQALGNRKGIRLFFETPCLDWILTHQAVWDFFYEHCSYFTEKSIRELFVRADFQVDLIKHVFDGQYLWIEASLPNSSPSHVPTKSRLTKKLRTYAKTEKALFTSWHFTLNTLHQSGSVAVWGAGGKGVMFANLFDPDCRFLSYFIDINPNKQGKFIPGTGHPIYSQNALLHQTPQFVILTNPNYQQECKEYLDKNSLTTQLIVSPIRRNL